MEVIPDNKGDYWRARHKARAAKRQSNLVFSTGLLQAKKVEFKSEQDGHWLIVEGLIDFWPARGTWRVKGSGEYGRGVREMLAKLKELKP